MRRGPVRRFRAWLKEGCYKKVSSHYPGAVLAEDLLQDYIEENPDDALARPILEKHAQALGYVSQEDWEDVDPEHDMLGEEEDLNGYGL